MSGKSLISILIPLALLCTIITIDLSTAGEFALGEQVLPIREILIFTVLLLFSITMRRHARTTEHSVVDRLQRVFFLLVITFTLIFILTPARILSLGSLVQETGSLSPITQSYWLSLVNAFIIGAFALLGLTYLRGLVYLKRKRHTARNFGFLLFFLFLIVFTRSLNKLSPFQLFGSNTGFESVLLFIFIIIVVINSLRVAWVNYLNRTQKIACFWGGLVVVPLSILISIKLHSTPPAEMTFSTSLVAFSEHVSLFFAIYVSAAYGALLFHLPTAAVFDRKIRQISSLRDLSRTVSSVFDFDELVDTITRLTMEATDSNFSWLLLTNEEGEKFRLASAKNLTKKERENLPTGTDDILLKRIYERQEPYLVNEAGKHSPLKKLRRWKHNLGSLLAVPLISSGQIKGVLCAAKREEYSYEQEDRDMLMAFADQAVVALENARLIQESILKERFEEELRIAHDAQMKLLPKVMPQVPKLDLDATCITANEVGGDYYDFFELDDGKLGIVIGDVSGKGPSAAFYMAEIKGIIESFAQTCSSPKELLIKANKTLFDSIDRKTFITMIYAVFDPKQRKFTFCRAGHCPPILCKTRSEEYQMLEPAGLGLGLDDGPLFDITIKEQIVRLRKGDVVLLYTDGVTEARNMDDEEFDEERLGKAMVQLRNLSTNEIREQLVERIETFVGEQQRHDDLTFVVMRVE